MTMNTQKVDIWQEFNKRSQNGRKESDGENERRNHRCSTSSEVHQSLMMMIATKRRPKEKPHRKKKRGREA